MCEYREAQRSITIKKIAKARKEGLNGSGHKLDCQNACGVSAKLVHTSVRAASFSEGSCSRAVIQNPSVASLLVPYSR
jgi:hypothetical protein